MQMLPSIRLHFFCLQKRPLLLLSQPDGRSFSCRPVSYCFNFICIGWGDPLSVVMAMHSKKCFTVDGEVASITQKTCFLFFFSICMRLNVFSRVLSARLTSRGGALAFARPMEFLPLIIGCRCFVKTTFMPWSRLVFFFFYFWLGWYNADQQTGENVKVAL